MVIFHRYVNNVNVYQRLVVMVWPYGPPIAVILQLSEMAQAKFDDKHDDLPKEMDLNGDFPVCYVKQEMGICQGRFLSEAIHLDHPHTVEVWVIQHQFWGRSSW
jgi:hypothetical protein